MSARLSTYAGPGSGTGRGGGRYRYRVSRSVVEPPGVEREHGALRILEGRDLAHADVHLHQHGGAELARFGGAGLGVVGAEVDEPVGRLVLRGGADASVAVAVRGLDSQVPLHAFERLDVPPEQLAVEVGRG